MSDALVTYLHDHHAGSVVIREMLAKAVSGESPDRAFLGRLDAEIASEQTDLEGAIARAGDGPSLPKKAGAWVAEKLARFKVGASHDPLPHLEFLDTLLTGVRGKLGLWEVLADLPAGHPVRADLDLAHLAAQAHDQIEGITTCRVAAFRRLVENG